MIRVLRRRVALLTDEEQLRRLLSRAASVEERGPSGCPSVDNITFPLLDWRIRVRVNSGPDKVIEFRASKQHTVEAELPSATQWSLHEVSRGTFVELNPVTPTRRPGFRHFGLETNDIGVTTANLKQRGIGVRTESERHEIDVGEFHDTRRYPNRVGGPASRFASPASDGPLEVRSSVCGRC